eukprot:13034338-Alexandrium_andersonii.AAC.1
MHCCCAVCKDWARLKKTRPQRRLLTSNFSTRSSMLMICGMNNFPGSKIVPNIRCATLASPPA